MTQSTPAFQINPGFAVPFALIEHPAPAALNAQLRELFLVREAQGARYANRNPLVQRNTQLFESNFQLFDWPDTPIAELREFCVQNIYRLVREINNYDLTTLRNMHMASESWFHITRRGGYFGLHNHAMASWSGVYCVNAGDDRSGVSDSGLLSFISPMAANTMFLDLAIARMQAPYTYGPLQFKLTAGQLILFPSWVLHEVKPYCGDGERITVAFNARFKMGGSEPQMAA